MFLGNVGEEGEGDLRGVRHFYGQEALAGRIAAHIVLDGAGSDSAVTQALGSRRYQVTITGPGGHSFTDAGTPNPIARTGHRRWPTLAEISLPDEPRTTLNLGTIHGGTSVNSIPESAHGLHRFPLHRAPSSCCGSKSRCIAPLKTPLNIGTPRPDNGHPARIARPLTFTIDKIGDRPAAHLPADSPLLEALRAVDRHLGLRTDLRLGSTDANIPLSLGVPASFNGRGRRGRRRAHTGRMVFRPRIAKPACAACCC